MRTSIRLLAVAAVLASTVVVGPQAGSAAGRTSAGTLTPAAAARAQAELDAYRSAHPDDMVGIDRILRKYGHEPMSVSVSGVTGVLSAEEAERVIARRGAENMAAAARSGVPTNAFTVSVSIYGEFLGHNKNIVGQWNFRDNYVNGSDPDDVAGIEVNLNGCWKIVGTSAQVADYQGKTHNSLVWLENGGVSNGSPAWGINDSVSGFKMLTDNGQVVGKFAPLGSGCYKKQIGGQFVYEHNQDGSGGVSVSIAWGAFSVSYSNPGSKMRKSTNPLWK
ncbi:MAG: hypothetical protein WA890_07545 [Micromonospora sp.]